MLPLLLSPLPTLASLLELPSWHGQIAPESPNSPAYSAYASNAQPGLSLRSGRRLSLLALVLGPRHATTSSLRGVHNYMTREEAENNNVSDGYTAARIALHYTACMCFFVQFRLLHVLTDAAVPPVHNISTVSKRLLNPWARTPGPGRCEAQRRKDMSMTACPGIFGTDLVFQFAVVLALFYPLYPSSNLPSTTKQGH
ncbi:hypothetical protein COCCADRAFT_22655 [Bipolaris zeicola 26-R-13]|uniref:Uncharacterized protein n=1 Tax=Cochliobolus carbonum (strain 26-R-13) TaxID=930089 RepID=W6YR67_COCC2|nr:uncharacterized protein COCCADRAFT_22655 [Bipolaris zeicola 26-R-13]EUC37909.1 hypothetical protein COCCADRAFT_22655 [Bipolaris zeicola 26-R-13]